MALLSFPRNASVFALLAASTLLQYTQATIYYVAPTDTDLEAKDEDGYGLTMETPMATLEYAVKAALPGDEFVLMDGVYKNPDYQDGDIWKSGSTFWIKELRGEEGNPIVIRGENSDRGATLKGDGNAIFQCRGCAHVVIQDLYVEGDVLEISLEEATENRFLHRLKDGDGTDLQRLDPGWTPEEIDAWFEAGNKLEKVKTTRPSKYNTAGLLIHSSWHVTVQNCEIAYAPGTGLRAQSSDYITFKHNVVHDCSRRGNTGTNGIVCHTGLNSISGEYVEDDGYRFVMWGNLIYNNYNEVYSWVDTKDYVHPYIDEGKGMSMEHLNSDDWITGRCLMANNVAYNNGLSGINSNDSDRIDLFHNTAYQNTASGRGTNTGVSCNASNDCKLKNNIAVSINDFKGRAINARFKNANEVDITDNQYIGTLSKKMPDGVGTEFAEVEEFAFDNVDGFDFRLTEGSVAIGGCPNDVLSGIALPGVAVANVDFDGKPRTNGDCGAFAFDDTGKGNAGGFQPTPEGGGASDGVGSATEVFESDPANWGLASGAAGRGGQRVMAATWLAVVGGALYLA